MIKTLLIFLFFFMGLTDNNIENEGAESLSELLMINTGLNQLNLGCWCKRNTNDFYGSCCSIWINSKYHWRRRSKIIKWSAENKHNTDEFQFGTLTYCFWNNQIWNNNPKWTVNVLGDIEVKSLSEALKINTSLTQLDLSG